MAFQKGHKLSTGGKREGSGRKDGELIRELKELAGSYREEAILRLAYWMRSDNPKASIPATIALLDRSDGKPFQTIAADDDLKEIARTFLIRPK